MEMFSPRREPFLGVLGDVLETGKVHHQHQASFHFMPIFFIIIRVIHLMVDDQKERDTHFAAFFLSLHENNNFYSIFFFSLSSRPSTFQFVSTHPFCVLCVHSLDPHKVQSMTYNTNINNTILFIPPADIFTA